MTPEPGWHGYWLNPGDAGKPIEPKWSLPKGVTARPLRYPVPQTLLVSGLMNHVYEGPYAVLAEAQVPPGLTPGTRLPIRVHLEWLACTDAICVPEQGDLAVDLVVATDQAAPPENRARFDGYRMKLPRPLGGKALFASDGAGGLRLSIPYPAAAPLDAPHFFPAYGGAKSYAGAQSFAHDGDRLIVTVKDLAAPTNGVANGVLKIGADKGLEIAARPGAVPEPHGEEGWRGVLLALVGAIVGGLLLNIMPCVFPVLSLKSMSLLRGATSPAATRHEAWAYAAGVMIACMGLGGAVIALRAGGASIGWAFQLQSPAVVLVLLALSIAITLELLGVWRLVALQIGGNLTTRRGLVGDFWSGVLVAFVATPCTGPFMAGALGAALVLPVTQALAVFAGLGLGIALPFLLLGHFPALRRLLPRPGAWMERVQRWLSVPMGLTAAALVWLLWRQAGMTGLTIGLSVATGVVLVFWWLGRAQKREARFAGIIALALVVVIGVGGAFPLAQAHRAAQAQAANSFSEAALTEARASGKPVFLYFTADWCLSCKVNEVGAIDRVEVRAAFDKADVRVIVGDWTNGDPVITRFLEAHGRSGVPLYLWYPAGEDEPQELPQILTPAMLIARAEGKS
jgi:thiol:disulfide interchange protein